MIGRTISTPISSLLLAVALVLGLGSAQATVWQPGDEITYNPSDWGGSSPSALQLLNSNFSTVYSANFGIATLGLPPPGFSISFTSAAAVESYLPASGPPAPLDANLSDPTSTVSGAFGGDVLTLRLNVDFQDAGFLVGGTGIPFGDLILANFAALNLPLLDGLTVHQFLGDVNTLLGGGASIYGIADLDLITADIDDSFLAGVPDQFAQDHLVVSPTTNSVPEPSTLLLFTSSFLVFGWMRRFRRQ